MKHWPTIAARFGSLLLAGCYRKTTDNGIVVTFAPWVPASIIFAGFVVVVLGVFLFARRQRLWGILAALGGIFFAGAVAPGMYQDKTAVTDQGFYSRHGFWWNPSIHDIRYEDLTGVR